MDNQHATPTDAEIGYLAAMFDGEGYVGLQRAVHRKRFIGYHARIGISNTDSNIIEKVQQIWNKLGINPHIYEKPSTVNPFRKVCMYIEVLKLSLIKETLEAVLPHLAGKRARAVMLLKFINNEIDRDKAYENLKELNKKGRPGEPSETTREAPALAG